MNKDRFTEKDEQNFIEFLNLIAKKAKFNDMSIQDNIDLFRLLSSCQKEILPKIKANTLEIKEVIIPSPNKEENV